MRKGSLVEKIVNEYEQEYAFKSYYKKVMSQDRFELEDERYAYYEAEFSKHTHTLIVLTRLVPDKDRRALLDARVRAEKTTEVLYENWVIRMSENERGKAK